MLNINISDKTQRKNARNPHGCYVDPLSGKLGWLIPHQLGNIRLITLWRYLSLFFGETFRRVYSETTFHIYRRDLTKNIEVKKPKIDLVLRPLHDSDIPELLNLNIPNLTRDGLIDRLRISQMIKADIKTCYVAVNADGRICHVAWLIDATQNEKFKLFFNRAIKPLAKDEVLFEFSFTMEEYRKLGIQRWRSAKFLQIGHENGAKWAIALIKSGNKASISTVTQNGYEIYMFRTDKWRFFKRKIVFKTL